MTEPTGADYRKAIEQYTADGYGQPACNWILRRAAELAAAREKEPVIERESERATIRGN